MSKIFRYLPQVVDFVAALESVLSGSVGQYINFYPTIKGVKMRVSITRI